ncbi:hypothetical protein LOTGIDRAFT_155474 [Lottia gigantea]|uniref:Ig-like domain-containing protein n=1 Tax=Lottia gigantea TaxID=225164 RepID=V4B6I4_LOTGI|nr:hypothetical protein LOTGIDRAFT_155474 [Lottia gigantea]ESO84149.1 hypothetical protein LOTGIDRAFT_155474 [Lottia gigantea]
MKDVIKRAADTGIESAQWAHWQEWSPCTEKCGFGQHFRVRTCSDPPPSGDNPGGCGDEKEEITPCYKGPCAESPSKAVVFSKGSFQKYIAHGTPVRFLTLYLHFKPLTNDATLLHRYRKCDAKSCSHNVHVKLHGNQVRLELQNGFGSTKITTDNTVKLGKWQTLFIQITRRLITIRLDDEYRKVTKFPNFDFPTEVPIHISKKLEEFDEIDFDADMIVGCDRHMKNAFVGSILKLRHNFKDMSLIHNPDWVGFGAPVAQKNVDTEEIESPEAHSRFLNRYYTKMHFEFPDKKKLRLDMSVYFMSLDGLLVFNYGETEGTFMSLALHRGALRFCFNVGDRTSCQKSILLQIRRWYSIEVIIDGSVAELRVDKGPAVILIPTGGIYVPKATVLIGGSDNDEWTKIGDFTRVDIGFDGIINEVNVNGKNLYLKQSVLFDRHGRVNADGYSLSAHVSEVFEASPSKVTLRCDASLFARKGGVVSINWLESDQLITGGGGEKIIDQVPGNRFESALILKPNHHHEGIFSCIISHDGFRIMTHTFPVLRTTHKLPVDWRVQLLIAVVPSTLLLFFIIACCCCFWCKRLKCCPLYTFCQGRPPNEVKGPIKGTVKGKGPPQGKTKLIDDLEKGMNSMTKLLTEGSNINEKGGKKVIQRHGKGEMGKKVNWKEGKGQQKVGVGGKDKKVTENVSHKKDQPDKAVETEESEESEEFSD